jgi:very-short-patch-repair endonuclease
MMLRRKKPFPRNKPLGAKRVSRREPDSGAHHKLWTVLENKDVAGLTFREYERIGPFVVDFLCPAARLVLLIQEGAEDDSEKTAWLEANGYRALEFPAAEVLADPNAVIETVARCFEIRIVARKD